MKQESYPLGHGVRWPSSFNCLHPWCSLSTEANSHSDKDQTFFAVFTTYGPRSSIYNMLKDHPLLVVRNCVFSIRVLVTALHIQKPYSPPATRGRAIQWWQGPTYQDTACRPYVTEPVADRSTVLWTHRVSAYPLTSEWEQIQFPKWCLHFWTKSNENSPAMNNTVTYHRQNAFVSCFSIHHCVWRYTMGNLLDISKICSGFKPFELFLFLCFSRSVQNVVLYRFFLPRKYTLVNLTHRSIWKPRGIHKEHTWSYVFIINCPREAHNHTWGCRVRGPTN